MRIKFAIAAALLAAGTMPPVAAQATKTDTAPSTTTIDPARISAANALLDAMNIERQYDVTFANLIGPITTQAFDVLQNADDVPVTLKSYLTDADKRAHMESIFRTEALKSFKSNYSGLRAATAREYAGVFTADELRQLADFYKSPVGQKSLIVMPQLQKELIPIGMAAGRKAGTEAMMATLKQIGFADAMEHS